MDSQLSLSVIEIIVLMAGAITLGITIHFFIVSRRSLRATSPITKQKINKELEERKLRYLNDIEFRDKEIAALKKRLADEIDNTGIYSIEAEELRKQNKQLQAQVENLRSGATPADKPSYVEQLRMAQANLREYNEKINQLLEQIDIVKETEEKQKEIERNNEELLLQVDELQSRLSHKEREMQAIRQKQELTLEMTSMLDNVNNEFNVLQDKLYKLESQVAASRKMSMEYEDIKEENFRLSRDLDELRLRQQAATADKQQLEILLAETEDKLREANAQRQQLQKKVAYLEELNLDMQAVADANKKLETQIRRIGELESMLHMVEEERNQLARKQLDA